VQTIIEISHRLTSGLSLLMIVALFFMTRRHAPRGSPLRSAAGWTLILILVEALIGAGLVLFELVAHNASLTRAVSMSAHLLNTFALLGALGLLIHRTSQEPQALKKLSLTDVLKFRLTSIAGLMLLLTGMTGAIAALGDTLYASFGSLPLQAYLDGEVPTLLRLRLIHPVVALSCVAYIFWYQVQLLGRPESSADSKLVKSGYWVSGMTLFQVGLGFLNIYLKAPVWMQLVHLGMGVALWVVFVFQSFRLHSKSQI
jgi:heme A synthase